MVASRTLKQDFSTPRLKPAAESRSPLAVRDIDLNIEPLKQTKVTHLIDWVKDFEGDMSIAQVTACLKQNNYRGLPEPLKPKQDDTGLGYTMSCVLDKTENGKWHVHKWIRFTQPQFFGKVKHLIYGDYLF